MTPKEKLGSLIVNITYRDKFLSVVDDNGLFALTNDVIRNCGDLIKRIEPLQVNVAGLSAGECLYDYADCLYSQYDPKSQGGNIGTYICINPSLNSNGIHDWFITLEEDNRWGGNPTILSKKFPYKKALEFACSLIRTHQ